MTLLIVSLLNFFFAATNLQLMRKTKSTKLQIFVFALNFLAGAVLLYEALC